MAETADDPAGEALQRVLEQRRLELESASQVPTAQSWLRPRLDTAAGMDQVYACLQTYVATPGFLSKLRAAKAGSPPPSGPAAPAQQAKQADVTQPEWWQSPTEPHQPGTELPEEAEEPEAAEGFSEVDGEEVREAFAPEPLDAYVMVERDDVMEAMATFVAAYLMQLPEAQHLKPAELQQALAGAIAELRQGRIRKLWAWGRCLYRCLAFSYGAFSVYENPWIVRALLAAVWTASRVLVGCLL